MTNAKYNLDYLRQLNSHDLAELTRRAAGGLGIGRLMLGRCLLVMGEEGRAWGLGYSGSLHLAILLGVSKRDAREVRRVARSLEGLPLLSEAAERGAIAWTSLREIVRKATVETEERWLELASEMSPTRIASLVALTDVGQMPDADTPEIAEPFLTELRAFLPPAELRIVELAMRRMSEEEGRPLTFSEAILALAVAKVAGSFRPDERVIEKIHREAELDVAAMEAPWAAVASKETASPADPEVLLARPSRVAHWENTRLAFNGQSRGVTPAQRLEIMRRDGYACSTPGCPHHLWLQIHHVVFYCQGGATVPSNLAACCSRCHSKIHEGSLTVRGDAPRGLRWETAHGGLELTGPLEAEAFLLELADRTEYFYRWHDLAA